MKLHLSALLLLLILTGCSPAEPIQKPIQYSTRVVDQPVLFAADIISAKESSEFNISFTPDGKTAFFTRRLGDEKQKLWQTDFENGTWTDPVQLPFSTDRDETPFFSPTDNTLYFGSARPIAGRPSLGNFDMNIWQVKWEKNNWGTPQPIDSSINALQQENEEWPSSNENFIFSLDNKEFIYCTMLRGDNVIEVYRTTRNGNSFSKPEKIEGLFENPGTWKSSAIVSPDGQYLVFNSYEAASGKGGEDIYIAKKSAAGWTRAKNIGGLVNTKAEEGSPRFSPDGNYFFFSRESRQNPDEDGLWDIYFIETAYLNLEQLFTN